MWGDTQAIGSWGTAESSRSLIIVEVYFLLAEGAEEFLFQPIIYAFFVKLVAACQGFHHLTGLEVVQADGTRLLVVFVPAGTAAFASLLGKMLFLLCSLLLFLVLETWDRVYDVFYFFW